MSGNKLKSVPLHVLIPTLVFLISMVVMMLPIAIACAIIYIAVYIITWPIYKLSGYDVEFIDISTFIDRKKKQKEDISK